MKNNKYYWLDTQASFKRREVDYDIEFQYYRDFNFDNSRGLGRIIKVFVEDAKINGNKASVLVQRYHQPFGEPELVIPDEYLIVNRENDYKIPDNSLKKEWFMVQLIKINNKWLIDSAKWKG